MVEFGGWEMPVQYGGLMEEHAAVRTRAGLFDVSHMGEVEIRGAGASDLCQRLTANDVSRIKPGQADRKSTRLNSSHIQKSRMPSSA